MGSSTFYKTETKETHRLLCSRCQESLEIEITIWPSPQAEEDLFYSWTCPVCGTGHLEVRFGGNGGVDAILFAGFLILFFVNLTGLSWHQWIGVAIGALSAYHLLLHWKWVKAVTQRMATCPPQTRWYYLFDIAILLGFGLIGITGLIISSWLELQLANYLAWKNVHVYASIVTLVLILGKIGIHWRWIIKTTSKHIGLGGLSQPAPEMVKQGFGLCQWRTQSLPSLVAQK